MMVGQGIARLIGTLPRAVSQGFQLQRGADAAKGLETAIEGYGKFGKGAAGIGSGVAESIEPFNLAVDLGIGGAMGMVAGAGMGGSLTGAATGTLGGIAGKSLARGASRALGLNPTISQGLEVVGNLGGNLYGSAVGYGMFEPQQQELEEPAYSMPQRINAAQQLYGQQPQAVDIPMDVISRAQKRAQEQALLNQYYAQQLGQYRREGGQ